MKHKKKKIFIAVALTLIIATAAFLFFACQSHESGYAPPPDDVHTVTATPPSDGSTPEDYEGLENLAFMAGRLAAREYYHSENNGLVDTIANQTVVGSKDYYKGLLITQSISTSAFVNVAEQKFFGDGKVVVRGPASGKNDWNGIHTQWSDDEPIAVYDEAQYEEAYGLWASEFSDYVMNEETVIDVSELNVLGDGLYSQTFTLDPASATYYYKHQMMTMGGLGDYPLFSSVVITFTFDDTWAVQRADITEEYEVYAYFMTVGCTATSSIVYSYDESDVDVSAYEAYFKKYADAAVTGGGDKELGVTDYLQQGFAGYLAEPSTFELSLDIGGEKVDGLVTLDITDGINVRALIGGIYLNVTDKDVIVSYKDLCGSVPLDYITEKLGLGGVLDLDGILAVLGEGTIVKDGENVTINCLLSLGGPDIPLTFAFTENASGITLQNVSVSLETDIVDISAVLAPTSGADVPETDVTGATDMRPLIDNVIGLISDGSFTVGLEYADAANGLALSGNIYVNAAEGVEGGFTLNYSSMSVPVHFVFDGESVYLKLYETGVRATMSELSDAVSALAEYLDIGSPETVSFDISRIITSLVGSYDTVIRSLAADNEGLALVIDGDALLSCIGAGTVSIGDISARYDVGTGAFFVGALGAEATLTGAPVRSVTAPEDGANYAELSVLESFVGPVKAIADSRDAVFSLEFDTVLLGLDVNVRLDGEVIYADTLTSLYIKALIYSEGYADETLELLYADGYVTLIYGGKAMRVAESDIAELAASIGRLTGGSDATVALALFGEDGIDINKLLESLRFAAREENGRTVADIFVDLGLINDALPMLNAQLSSDGESIFLDVKNTELFGLTVSGLAASVKAGSGDMTCDLTGVTYCGNIVDFAFNLLVGFMDSPYMQVSVSYRSELIDADVTGLFLLKETETTALDIDFRVQAEIHVYAYSENGEKVSDGSHYLDMTVLGESAYITYSLYGFGADGALNVTLPVSQLFEIGDMVLPLLGIDDTAYYFDMVNNLLSTDYTYFSTGIFDVMQFADIIGLLDGVTPSEGSENGGSSVADVTFGNNESGEKTLTVNGIGAGEGTIGLNITAKAEGEITADTSRSYIDISSISYLLGDLLDAYEYVDTGYALSGNVKMKVLGIELDLTVNLDLRVGVDEDGLPYLNIKLSTNGYANALGNLIPGWNDVVIVNGDTETDITYKDGNIYMTRVQKTAYDGWDFWGAKYKFRTLSPYSYEYRRMTLSEFGADAMNQMFFALNIASKFSNYISSQVDSTEPANNGSDAGDMVNGYSFDGNVYNLKLNMGAIADNDALGELDLNITRQMLEGRDYYDLVRLNGSIKLVSVVTATFDITHDSVGAPVDLSIIDENISRVNANVV